MELVQKLAILADAAKYDASCASGGTQRRDSRYGKGIGSTGGMGICHSYAPDGRCISLLKILLTNFCQFDCLYCVNRVSSNVPRARFTAEEVVELTLDFYRRNCIEGLFLSSGIIQSADYTMEQLVEVARSLREDYAFKGYIHLKTIPDASPDLLVQAGRHADRLSINIELPTPQGLQSLAPQKDAARIRLSMNHLHQQIQATRPALASGARPAGKAKAPRFAPGGQSTQMIVGADATDDATILQTSSALYRGFGLRRVYYSAFSPIPDASSQLPLRPPPLMREHRLYQADWLMRFYGFSAEEIVPDRRLLPGGYMNATARVAQADAGAERQLALDIDPKLAWALAHPECFPVDLNRAPRETLLRVPGLGVKAVQRILHSRRARRLRREDLEALHVPVTKVLPFVVMANHLPKPPGEHPEVARALRPRQQPVQPDLFDSLEVR